MALVEEAWPEGVVLAAGDSVGEEQREGGDHCLMSDRQREGEIAK